MKKEELDKKLLNIEAVLRVSTIFMFVILVMVISYIDIQEYIKLIIISVLTIYLIVICFLLLFIEQIAGYYECRMCKHKYVPKYSKILWAMHIGRTRYMKCPKCNKISWQKKVL